MEFEASRYDLLNVAQGKQPADLFLLCGQVINVYSGEILEQNIAVYKDRIAYVGSSTAAIGEQTKVLDCSGKYISPGFIETHSHPWVVYNPVSLTEKVLPLGTTAMMHDNLFFYLYMGAEGFTRMVKDLRSLPGVHRWLVRIVPQSKYPEERDWFNSRDLQSLLELDEVAGTAEVTRWPTLYDGDPFVIETVEFAKGLGKISDGHTSGCSYERLNSIVAAGISACHEAIRPEEVLDRLRLGMWTTLRNSSLRPDFPELVKAITESKLSTNRLLMTSDGPHPGYIDENGFMDGLLRQAVELGIPPVQAVQMATLNAATYLRMEDDVGGIAPGRRADINILPNLVSFRPEMVISGGRVVAENGQLTIPLPSIDWSQYLVREAFPRPLEVYTDSKLYAYPSSSPNPNSNRNPSPSRNASPPSNSNASPWAGASVPVIDFPMAVITKRRDVELPVVHDAVDLAEFPDLSYAALVDREGKWVSHAILRNFIPGIEGMASTYNTTTHLLVIGRDLSAMSQAAKEVVEMGGGISVVEQGRTILRIPLPFTGMMTTDGSFSAALKYHNDLYAVVRDRGYRFHDILYSLLFLTCDCLPGLRLIAEGIYDVKTDSILVPAKKLESAIR